jgi:hypothetical protein
MTTRLVLIAAVALALPAAVSASGAAAASANKPDLAIRSVSTPRSATPGAPFDVQLIVARRGRPRGATIGMYLSRDRVRDPTDQHLAGSARMPGSGAGARAAAVRLDLQAGIPSGQALGSYFVIACFDDPGRIRGLGEHNDCRTSALPLAVAATPVSTVQLLAAAVAAHKLSPQQALVYRVFAAFGDRRLPSAYAGDALEPDDVVMRAAEDAWPTLSAAQQAELRPFFTPPAASGSWFSPSASPARGSVAAAATSQTSCKKAPPPTRGWITLAKPGGHVRLWWQRHDNARIGPRMRALMNEAENTIWPRLDTLMGREPLSDAGLPCFHGGDGKLDIYMVRGTFNRYTQVENAIGVTIPYTRGCAAPAFIVLDVHSGAPSRSTLAHELMHSFQFAFHYRDTCDSYSKWDESTATWAEQYIYPHDDEEHMYGPWYPDSPLTKAAYDGWLFPYAMEQLHGAETIAAVYRQMERLPLAQALDAGLPGGLAQAWPEFALKAWNAGPVAPSFKQWDNFDQQPLEAYTHQPVPAETLNTMSDSQPENVSRTLPPLTRDYRHFTLAPKVTMLSISQQLVPGIRVDAIERFGDGTTRIEQLQGSRTFCSTDPAKRLADLVLVISNSSPTSTGLPDPLKLLATDDACGPVQYRILSASITERVSASEPGGLCAQFGGISGSKTITGTSTGPAPDDERNQLTPISAGGGPMSGQISGPTIATISTEGNGCNGTSTGLQRCSYAYSNVPFSGPLAVGFDIWVANPDSGQARLTWVLLNPAIGSAADPCFVMIGGDLPFETRTQTVPLATLLSADPQTFTLAGSTHLDQDNLGSPASIDYDWKLSLTVQRR